MLTQHSFDTPFSCRSVPSHWKSILGQQNVGAPFAKHEHKRLCHYDLPGPAEREANLSLRSSRQSRIPYRKYINYIF